MGFLGLASVLWVAVHVGIAGTAVRRAIAGRIGEGLFRLVFSVLSVATIVFLVGSYNAATPEFLWEPPGWAGWVFALLMLAAFILLVASVLVRNPTSAGGEGASANEPRGILRVTRHPMLWAFSIWAAVHVLSNGDSASLWFFGAFLVTSLVGMPSIDAKVARREPGTWPGFAAKTSILPFGAIAAGRNRLSLTEIGSLPFAIGIALWAVLLWAHPRLFGVAAMPW